MYYIDIHTHKPIYNSETISILNIRLGNNNPKPETRNPKPDTQNPKPDTQNPKLPFSSGLHPWDLKDLSDINLLEEIIQGNSLAAIGECGFDKNIKIPFSIQKEIFIKQVEISESFHKPLIIHCVGYFNELIILKNDINPAQQWIIHGFTGHIQLAKQLIDKGFMLSFGKAIFDDKSKAVDSFKIIPENSFFLETDECEKSIQEIYLRASQLKSIAVENLKSLIYNNFIKAFNQKYGME